MMCFNCSLSIIMRHRVNQMPLSAKAKKIGHNLWQSSWLDWGL